MTERRQCFNVADEVSVIVDGVAVQLRAGQSLTLRYGIDEDGNRYLADVAFVELERGEQNG